ncbi:MAG: hypothetical protein QT10_C0016G0002 [archaeon GW2011_AR19]|nr:MAG: hypothetical protein QT10_C0016G0002 [archaeon GW2011_AR19]
MLSEKARMENRKTFQLWGWIIILVAIITGYLGIPKLGEFLIAKIVLGPILGIITGAIAGYYAELLDELTQGLFKEEWVFEIGEIEISIPILVIVTLIIEIILFS